MDYLDGMSLAAYVAHKGGRLPWEAALAVVRPMLDALSEIHAAGLAHRDIDPNNVYITRKGGVVLLDFGAAREVTSEVIAVGRVETWICAARAVPEPGPAGPVDRRLRRRRRRSTASSPGRRRRRARPE